MEIRIVDPRTFAVYKEYLSVPSGQETPSQDKPFVFEVQKLGKAAPAERWRQLFGYVAIQDGNRVLSLEEAKRVDEYYKSTHPSLRAAFRFDFNSTPQTDPKLEEVVASSPLGFLEWFAGGLPGAGAGEDLLAAVNRYPKLAIFIHPDCRDVLAWLIVRFNLLKDHPEQRLAFLDAIGEIAEIHSFYEPVKFSLAKNREGMLKLPRLLEFQMTYEAFKGEDEYYLGMQDPEILLRTASGPNIFLVADALRQMAKMQIDKTVILDKLNHSSDFLVYGAGLEALAIWGDEESIQILEDTIRYGSFQQHIKAMFALREYLPTDRLAETMQVLLEDEDAFVRGAGLKILQFAWHRYGFDHYRNHFQAEVKYLAENDPNKYVRMAAVECIGYSHKVELTAWLDTLGNDADLIPFIENAQRHARNRTLPSGYDNTVDFQSNSYLYPLQSQWIVDALHKRAKEGQIPLRVLMTGCSFGAEAFSLLLEIMKDYERNPSDWGDFKPQQDLKISCSDIDTQPLLYAERGYYYLGGPDFINEFKGMQFYHKVYGTDFYRDLERFFEPAQSSLSEVDVSQFRLRRPYSGIMATRYLDVTETPKEPQAEIVTFNKLDYLWAEDVEATMAVVENLFKLSSRYVAYVTWGNPWTPLVIEIFGTPLYKSESMGLLGKKEQ